MKTSNIILFTGLTLFIAVMIAILFYVRYSFFYDEDAEHITGSGIPVEIVQELDSFDRVRIAGNIPVYLHRDERERIHFKMDSNLPRVLKAEVENGKLSIYTTRIVTSEILEVHLYFVELKNVETYSGASVFNHDTYNIPLLDTQEEEKIFEN